MVTNPVVEDAIAAPAARSGGRTVITHEAAFYWAHLVNVRYRLLLGGLTHLLEASAASTAARPGGRGELIAMVFGEMYKLRAIASVLVDLPARDGVSADREAAGPPFAMPYTLLIPPHEPDRWRWHRSLLVAARGILARLGAHEQRFVAALRAGDTELIDRIDAIVAHLEGPGRGGTT